MKSKFMSIFYPPKDVLDSLSLKVKTQLPIIIVGALVCALMFILFGITNIFSAPYLSIFSLVTVSIFGLAIILIKKGKIMRGVQAVSIGFLFACIMITFFSPYYETTVLPYRTACFLAVMIVCNQFISIRNRQLILFSIGTMLIWIASCFSTFWPLFQIDFSGTIRNIIICTIGLLLSNTAIIFNMIISNKIIDTAEKKEEEAIKALETITKVFEESKEGFSIGKRLSESADSAKSNVSEIGELYKFLVLEANNLTSESLTIKNASNQISLQATRMKESVHEQNSSITETSAAMTEISANISNINGIANKRRAGMNEIVNALDAQLALIREIVDQVEKVRQSSDGIAAFVNTVDSIASQTGLLAMNASIEAAHAGTLGKGFSVIAQEIRKLSEETTKNAALISETLKTNTEIVNATTNSVSSFADHTKKSSAEIKTTIQAIEEILAGISEMDTGTQEVMKSLQTIVDEAHLNAELVANVTTEITQQTTAINNISTFASEMEAKVTGLDDLLRNIKIAIASIKKDAEENNVVSEKINNILK